jgi:hypothetical protein
MLTTMRRIALAGTVVAVSALGTSTSALAHSGEFAKFNDCPSTNVEVKKCLISITNGGKIILGSKETPITNPVTLQGGFGKPNSEHISKFYEAVNGGETLSKTPQPVPGGLAGLVKCPEISNFFERLACELVFENGVTGVNATLELAKPASEIKISEFNLLVEEGLALQLPVKIHLENPFLGSSCYVGSNSAPMIWNLTTGETTPPAGVKPMKGSSGLLELKEETEIAQLTGNELVDNNWKAPGVNGCSEPFSLILDPIIDLALGLPASEGVNSALLKNTIDTASAGAVNAH